MKEEIFKYDINFLEYPLWTVNDRDKSGKLIINRPYGTYKITAPTGESLPTHFDVNVLYCLLSLRNNGHQPGTLEFKTIRYALAKSIFAFKNFGARHYTLIIKSLEKWKGISIRFDGTFYEENRRTLRLFGVIDDVILDRETNELFIRFNQQFIQQQDATKFCKSIHYDQFKKLTRATSARLYEILIKSFHATNTFMINLDSLGEKLTLEKRKDAPLYYPSDIVPKLKVAVQDISEKTELKVVFEFNKEGRMCLFKRL